MVQMLITGGSAYTDIDVLASAVAYSQCLRLQGVDALSILRAPFNETISHSIRSWCPELQSLVPKDPEKFHYVLVDVSDPAYFESFVVLENVVEVLDHHFGFEDYWRERLGDKGCVKHVGSCATLVWERFKQAGVEMDIGAVEANLLYTAIFANTLGLKSHVTHERDRMALEEVESFTQLPAGWMPQYYREVEEKIFLNPAVAIGKDTKRLVLGKEQAVIGQLEVWDATELLQRDDLVSLAREGMQIQKGERWLLLISDIDHQITCFVTEDYPMKAMLSKAIGDVFSQGAIGKTERLWMRKEVIRELANV